MFNYKYIFVVFLVLTGFTKLSAQTWEATNGPLGGVARAVAINPEGTIFVGSPGGVFYSTINGDSWQRTGGSVNSSFLTRMIVTPDSGHIYLGTTNVGLYQSKDNGESWDRLNKAEAVPASNIQAITYSTDGDLIVGTDRDGIFISSDNGVSWTDLNEGLPDLRVFAAAKSNNGNFYTGSINMGVHRFNITDSTWVSISDGLANMRINYLKATGENEMLAATGRGVYKIAASDTTWTEVGTNTAALGLATSVYEDSTGQLFATTLNGVWRYDATADTWKEINNGLTNLRTWEITGNQAEQLFVVSDGGIFRSEDKGANWTYQVDGFKISRIEAMVELPDGAILAGTQSNGIFRSENDGLDWVASSEGLDNLGVRSLEVDASGNIFAGMSGLSGVARSTDLGNSWEIVRSGFNGSNVYAIKAIANKVYAAPSNGGLNISADGGDTWQAVPDSGLGSHIRAIAETTDGIVLAGTNNNGMFKLMPNDTVWTEINNGLTSTQISSLAWDASGDLLAGTTRGIFRSQDNGDNWTEINAGLTSTRINDLKVASSGDIFAATTAGVAFSRDNGETWAEITSGLNVTNIYSLVVTSSGQLYAGSSGDGVYRTEIFLTSVDKSDETIPAAFSLMQNYPNPFNPTTSIEFQLPEQAHVELTIFNALGQKVAALVNVTKPAGSHTVRWDGRNDDNHSVASGLYIYRLQSGNFTSSKKLILMR